MSADLDVLVMDLQDALEAAALAGLVEWVVVASILDRADERVAWLTRADLIERTRMQLEVIRKIREDAA